jgi:TonB family protein
MLRALVAISVMPLVAGTQQPAERCTVPSSADSLTVFVVGHVTSFKPNRELPRSYTGLFVQGIRERLQLPRPFVLTAYSAPDSLDGQKNDPPRGYAALFGMLAITVDHPTAAARVLVSSGVPGLDSAVINAIRGLSAEQVVPVSPDWARGQLDLRLRIYTTLRVDSGEVLFRLRVPMQRFSASVRPRSKTAALQYPDELRAANIQGSVLVQFVVDEMGVLLPGSALVIKADHELFARAAVDYLMKAQFEPATIGNCPVAVLVGQPFNFSLRP